MAFGRIGYNKHTCSATYAVMDSFIAHMHVRTASLTPERITIQFNHIPWSVHLYDVWC